MITHVENHRIYKYKQNWHTEDCEALMSEFKTETQISGEMSSDSVLSKLNSPDC